MSKERVVALAVDPHSSLEEPPDKSLSLSAFNEKMDSYISELDSIPNQALSEQTSVSSSSQRQESLIVDPISSPAKPSRPLESGSVLVRDVRALQAVMGGISALVKLCGCSIHDAIYAFHFCSGNVLRAKQLLEGKGGMPWTAEEDRLLLSRSLNNYYALLKYRTPDDLKRRLNYFAVDDT